MKALIAVVLALVLVLPAAVSAEKIELTDTGYDLAPGYRYVISVEVGWTRLYGFWSGDDAEITAGPLLLKVFPDPGLLSMDYRVQVYVSGEKRYDERVNVGGLGKGTSTFDFLVAVDCSGAGTVDFKGQRVAAFSLLGAADIVSSGSGKTTVTLAGSYGCNGGGGGTITVTLPPSDSSGDLAGVFTGAVGKALTLLFLGGAVLALLILYSQAKRRRLVG